MRTDLNLHDAFVLGASHFPHNASVSKILREHQLSIEYKLRFSWKQVSLLLLLVSKNAPRALVELST